MGTMCISVYLSLSGCNVRYGGNSVPNVERGNRSRKSKKCRQSGKNMRHNRIKCVDFNDEFVYNTTVHLFVYTHTSTEKRKMLLSITKTISYDARYTCRWIKLYASSKIKLPSSSLSHVNDEFFF